MSATARSGFYCGICDRSTRYRHKEAQCDRCGKRFCRQKSTAKYCSEYCRHAPAWKPCTTCGGTGRLSLAPLAGGA